MGQAPGLGYRARAGFRLITRCAATDIWPVTGSFPRTALPSTLGWPKIGYWDGIPFTKESVDLLGDTDMDEVLNNQGGYPDMYKTSELPGGQVELQAYFIGLDAILAAALGYERIRNGLNVESPDPVRTGDDTITATKTAHASSSTTTTLVSAASDLANAKAGDYVRIIGTLDGAGGGSAASTDHQYDEVRKIVAGTFPATNTVTIAPAWATGGSSPQIPHSKKFQIARSWKHTFECAKNLHGEKFADVIAAATNEWVADINGFSSAAQAYMTRSGVLVFDKGANYWEHQYAMVDKLSLKYDSKGLTITTDWLVLYTDLTNAAAQNSLYWDYQNDSDSVPASLGARTYSADAVIIRTTQRVLFPHGNLYLKTFSTSSSLNLTTDRLGISAAELKIDNKLTNDRDTQASYYRVQPVRGGIREISLTVEMPRYQDKTRFDYFRNETALMGKLTFLGGNITTSVPLELTVWLRRMKAKPAKIQTPGASTLTEKLEFQCLMCDAVTGNPSGFPTPTTGIGVDNGEIIIQTVNTNPFNAFMDQNVEY